MAVDCGLPLPLPLPQPLLLLVLIPCLSENKGAIVHVSGKHQAMRFLTKLHPDGKRTLNNGFIRASGATNLGLGGLLWESTLGVYSGSLLSGATNLGPGNA